MKAFSLGDKVTFVNAPPFYDWHGEIEGYLNVVFEIKEIAPNRDGELSYTGRDNERDWWHGTTEQLRLVASVRLMAIRAFLQIKNTGRKERYR